MKSKKWLLIAVAILLLINGAYYFVFNVIGFDNFVKGRLEAFLSSNSKSVVSIEKLDFNDKQITLYGLSSYGKQYSLEIQSVTVDYNPLFLFFVRFLPRKAIKKVLVYKPEFTVKSQVEGNGWMFSGQNWKSIVNFLPDFAVVEGSLDFDLHYLQKFSLRERIDVFSCNYDKSEEGQVYSSFYMSKGLWKLEGSFALTNGVLDTFRVEADSFALPGFGIDALDSVNFQVDGYAYGSHKGFLADLSCTDFSVVKGFFVLNLPAVKLKGDEQALQIDVEDGKLLDLLLQFKGSLINGLDQNMEFLGNFSLGSNIAVKSIYAKRSREKEQSKWKIMRAVWLDNILKGEFFTDYKSFKFSLGDSLFVIKKGDFLLQSALQMAAFWDVNSGFRADISGDSLLVSSKNFIVDDAQLQGNLIGSDFTLSLFRTDSLATIDFQGNLFKDSCFVAFRSKKLDPNLLLKQKNRYLPMCRIVSSGYISDKVLHSQMDIFLDDSYYGLVSGSFGSQFVYDFALGRLEMSLESYKSTFNYNLFNAKLHAVGSFDSLMVDELVINKKMRGQFLLTKSDGYRCEGYLLAESLQLQVWQKYFTRDILSQELNGELSLGLQLANDGVVKFDMRAKDVSYGDWQGMSADLQFSGDVDSLLVDRFELCSAKDTVLYGNGKVLLDSIFRVKGVLDIDNLNLTDMQKEGQQKWFGIVNGQIKLDFQKDCPLFSANLSCEDFGFGSFNFSLGRLKFLQERERFIVEQCDFEKSKEDVSLRLKGELGYNFLNGFVFPSDDKLQIFYQGDFLKGLVEFLPYIQQPESQSQFALNLHMSDRGLEVDEGVFSLKNGSMKIKNQPVKVEEINIDLSISKDSLFFENCKAKMGEGYLNVSNEFSQSEPDFVLGNLNLGKIFFWTSGGKVTFYYPNYMDDNAVAKAEVKGVGESEKAFVRGPADDLLISSRLCISDAQAMFPKKSKNLLKLITESYSLTRGKKPVKLPFSIDLELTFEDDVYYKTYPLNLLVEKGSFLLFHYEKDDNWKLTNGELISRSGDMELFGSVFTADEVKLHLSKTNSLLDVYGKFEATAVDGNTVTLELMTKDKDRFAVKDNIEMNLQSTDRDLTSQMQIVSSLKYDISQEKNDPGSQIQTFLNSQVIDLVGGGVQSQVLDPLISPVENSLQRALRLDLFRIKMNVVQNLLEDYDNQQSLEADQETMGSSDILLNKMKILLGKSLTNRLFFVSEFKIEESDDPLQENKELFLNQKVGFRYVLPYNFRFQYNYNFNEDPDKNLYELNLKKSVDF